MKKIKKPIFIIGVGRSGTTLLQSMLNSNSKIAFTPETHFIRKHIANVKEHCLFKYNKYQILKNIFIKDKYLNRINIDALIKNKLKMLNNLSEFYDLFLSNYLVKKNKKYIGDKDPKNLEYLELINNLYPEARIIHIFRDPRDVVLSRLKVDWSKNRGVYSHAITYQIQYKKARQDGFNFFKDNYYEIQYENLITNPLDELSNLCSFLNIPFGKNMLEYYESSNEIINKDEANWKNECFKPLQTDNLNKWKNNLSQKELYLIEKICKSLFLDKKYSNSSKSKTVHPIIKLIFIFMSLPVRFIDLLYNFYFKIKNQLIIKYL